MNVALYFVAGKNAKPPHGDQTGEGVPPSMQNFKSVEVNSTTGTLCNESMYNPTST